MTGRRRAGDPRGRRRGGKVRVQSAKGRKASSTRWLKRHLNDPYVAEAKRLGYRARSAFKLIEIDEKFGILKKAQRVVDLGAAPGGWLQVAVEQASKGATIVGIDLEQIEPVAGTDCLVGDFLDPAAQDELKRRVGGPVDVVLSDMAAATTGHKQTDHLRTMALCEAALEFAAEVLGPGGAFVAKVLQGGTEVALLERMQRDFAMVKHFKPAASRAESVEMYVVATGYRAPARN